MALKKSTVTKKSSGRTSADSKSEVNSKPPSRRSVSLPKRGKDPKGGLTAEGRRIYNQATGGHLKPGVRGPADTPEKMVRKGSFLRRHFATPRGPVVDDQGRPTRQALEAAAWGEPVPRSEAEEKKLADKGTELLERYHAAKGDVKTASGRWKADPSSAKKLSANAPRKKKAASAGPRPKSTANATPNQKSKGGSAAQKKKGRS